MTGSSLGFTRICGVNRVEVRVISVEGWVQLGAPRKFRGPFNESGIFCKVALTYSKNRYIIKELCISKTMHFR